MIAASVVLRVADCEYQGRLSYVHTTQTSGLEIDESSTQKEDGTPSGSQDICDAASAPSLQEIPKLSSERYLVEENEPRSSGIKERRVQTRT